MLLNPKLSILRYQYHIQKCNRQTCLRFYVSIFDISILQAPDRLCITLYGRKYA